MVNPLKIRDQMLNTPDISVWAYFVESDVEKPENIKEKTQNFPFCNTIRKPTQTVLRIELNRIKQTSQKLTNKLVCGSTNKCKCMFNYRMLKFSSLHGMCMCVIENHSIWSYTQGLRFENCFYFNMKTVKHAKTYFERIIIQDDDQGFL